MGYTPDILLSLSTADFIFDKADEIERDVHAEAENSDLSPTRWVNSVRASCMLREISCLGIFSRFEGYLARVYDDVPNPLSQLHQRLCEEGHHKLANNFKIIRMANNAIKHGQGESLNWLCERKSELWFRVKEHGENYFEEGDLSEIEAYVDTSGDYFPNMRAILEECMHVLPELNAWA